jgi:hypothetical protein
VTIGNPAQAIAAALRKPYHQDAVGQHVIAALLEEGWHLVSTPELTETREPVFCHLPGEPLVSAPVLELRSFCDRRIFTGRRVLQSAYFSDDQATDHRRWTLQEMSRELLHRIGATIGCPGVHDAA